MCIRFLIQKYPLVGGNGGKVTDAIHVHFAFLEGELGCALKNQNTTTVD